MFFQNINLPTFVEKESLKSVVLSDIFARFNLSFQNVLVVTGRKFSADIAAELISKNNLNFHIRKDCGNSLQEIVILRETVIEKGIDLVLGIGGGRILDIAKHLASKCNVFCLAAPTLVTTDTLASPIAILNDGEKEKAFRAQIPNGIILDFEIIAAMTDYQLYSGLGDILSNQSALLDWELAIESGKEKPNNFAKFLSEVSISLVQNDNRELRSAAFLENYVNAIISSGLAMNIAGNTRPCSGSEHLIAHAISNLGISNHSHGYLVGCLTPLALSLHGKNFTENRLLLYFKEAFKELAETINCWEEVIDLALTIRGQRYTVLNTLKQTEILNIIRDLNAQ